LLWYTISDYYSSSNKATRANDDEKRESLVYFMVKYNLHPQMFIAFDFLINFEHLFYLKMKVIKNQIYT
jgi:hypothetical protein